MTETTNNSESTLKGIRLKPMLIAAIAVILLHYVLPKIITVAMALGMIGGVVGGLFILIWWTFFSRAPLFERWGVFVCTIIIFVIATFVLDESIATSMVGMMFAMSSLPVFSILIVVWAYGTKKLTVKSRRTLMFTSIFISFGIWTLLRTDGMTGQAKQELKWRWSETYENQFISNAHTGKPTNESNDINADEIAQWPGFRGANRDAVVHDLKIETDWQNNPPKELWRKPIGPGCSSFAIKSHLAFTQEQFDSLELVSCYDIKTGEMLWKHNDSTRFWDSHAGAGPRSTPTLFGNQVFTLGATGILNVLNEKNGELVWSRNAAKKLGTTIPGWAYCGSPLVVDSVVIVAVSGVMAAYDISDGTLRWKTEDGGESYSSPHLLTIDGIKQVLFLHHSGADSYEPSTGKKLWSYPWEGGARIIQPALTRNGDLLLGKADGRALRRLKINHENNNWTFEELWTSSRLRPYFNDFVVHKGCAYGFDGPSLVCISLETGERQWKGSRYAGQLIMLADQDVMLVLTEKGEMALVAADPEQFNELSILQAIQGKTWSHAALSDNKVIMRNTKEMAVYQFEEL